MPWQLVVTAHRVQVGLFVVLSRWGGIEVCRQPVYQFRRQFAGHPENADIAQVEVCQPGLQYIAAGDLAAQYRGNPGVVHQFHPGGSAGCFG